jgi:hypothetical protein
MKLTISRKIWLRGRPSESCLLNMRGERCCLGIYGQSLGVSDEAMQFAGAPMNEGVAIDFSKKAPWLLDTMPVGFTNSQDATSLMRANDADPLNESERESRVQAIFAKHGVTVEFVD